MWRIYFKAQRRINQADFKKHKSNPNFLFINYLINLIKFYYYYFYYYFLFKQWLCLLHLKYFYRDLRVLFFFSCFLFSQFFNMENLAKFSKLFSVEFTLQRKIKIKNQKFASFTPNFLLRKTDQFIFPQKK